jgi:hypothetical protein
MKIRAFEFNLRELAGLIVSHLTRFVFKKRHARKCRAGGIDHP